MPMSPASTTNRIVAAALGGVLGFCIGPVTGSMLAGLFSGPSGSSTAAEVGRFSGMAIGALGGATLGAYLVGRPIVARWTLGLGAALGGVAFLAGFAGPILLTPDSPQGPLLGIFITGPIGFILGLLLGLAIGTVRQRRSV